MSQRKWVRGTDLDAAERVEAARVDMMRALERHIEIGPNGLLVLFLTEAAIIADGCGISTSEMNDQLAYTMQAVAARRAAVKAKAAAPIPYEKAN